MSLRVTFRCITTGLFVFVMVGIKNDGCKALFINGIEDMEDTLLSLKAQGTVAVFPQRFLESCLSGHVATFQCSRLRPESI